MRVRKVGSLQMVSESNTKLCANEDVGPEGSGIVRSHIDWRRERSIPYKDVEASPQWTNFKTLKGCPEGKGQREHYLLAVGLGCY